MGELSPRLPREHNNYHGSTRTLGAPNIWLMLMDGKLVNIPMDPTI